MDTWHGSVTDSVFGMKLGEQTIMVHSPEQCASQGACAIHRPSDHHMRDFPMHYRADRDLMERICPCGVGHPDPDDLKFHISNDRAWQALHGCCGCCDPTDH